MPVAPLPAETPLCPDRDGHRYVIEGVLGSGGFGITYRARDQRLHGYVVVKELAFEGTAYRDTSTGEVLPHEGKKPLHRKMVTRFLREARLLNRIRNPYVVRVFDVWEERGTAYYAMDEVVDAGSLDPVTDGFRLDDWEAVASRATQLLEALGAVHEAGMVHGDIKPDNVLVTAAGEVALIDFGTVRSDADLGRTVTSMSFTPGYAPPELMQAVRVREAGPWSDLYSWGMLVYGLVRPHQSQTGQPIDALGRMMGDDPYTSAETDLIAAGMPKEWATVVASCVAIAPYHRPRSVDEAKSLLGASVPTLPTPSERRERSLATDPTVAFADSEATERDADAARTPTRLVSTVPADGSDAEIRAPKSFAGWWAILGMTLVIIAAAVVGIGPRIPPVDSGDVGPDADRPVFEVGETCSSGDDCTTDRCSNGRCAPLGSSFVPAGSFAMGPSYVTPGGVPIPPAQITISTPLWVDSAEVTQAQWEEVMGTNPSRFLSCGTDCPVERVSWYDAIAFANARSIAEELTPCYHSDGCVGEPGGGCDSASPDRCEGDFVCSGVSVLQMCTGYRLPTEAEWEYAARAGAGTPLPGGELMVEDLMASSSLDSTAWYGGNSAAGYVGAAYCDDWNGRSREIDRCGTHPVGFKPPNRWGLYDVIGSVSEWTGDGFMRLHELEGADPFGALELPDRGVRGGAWSSFALNCRLGFRDAASPTTRAANLGFRLARSAADR